MSSEKKRKSTIIPFPSEINTQSSLLNLDHNQKLVCEMAARCILKALDLKDHYTFGHSMRVAYYSVLLGKQINLSASELYDLELAAMFHDLGKIGVSNSILNKPSRLDEDEFLAMKSHPDKTFEILQEFPAFKQVATYAKHHHERYDGKGYPDGLKGENIPLHSRIILIADTFDSMTSDRPYRKGLPFEVATNELEEFKKIQFDPRLVDIFNDKMKEEENSSESTFKLSIMDETYEKKAA